MYFVEDSDDFPSCYDPTRHVTDTDFTYGISFADQAFKAVGLEGRWAYYDAHSGGWHGPTATRMDEICSTADLLLNVSGANPIRDWFDQVPRRAFIDTDPAFEQVRQLTVPERRQRALQHNRFFSFGENIANNSSHVPDDDLPWKATRQPVVLNAWPLTNPPERGKMTSIMQWESYPAREFNGIRYGLKCDSFLPYLDLPEVSAAEFELALGSPTAPRELLRSKGWLLRDPVTTTHSLESYQDYIQQSRAEFSVAKHGYVVARTGWFSERTANYLASGRPVVVQDTGFTEWLKVDAGVLPFNTSEEACQQIADLDARYELHCSAAREIAGNFFDAKTVLRQLIETAMQ